MRYPKIIDEIAKIKKSNDFLETITIENNNLSFDVFYYTGICNIDFFNEHYFNKITPENYLNLDEHFPGTIKKLSSNKENNLRYELSKGNIIFSVNKYFNYYVELSKLSNIKQQPSHIDPTNVFETKNDLSDSAVDNVALIMKRIKNENLFIKHLKLGKKSATDCFLLVSKEFEDENYAKIILNKLESANDDYYLNVNDLNKHLMPESLVPLSFFTSQPSTICSNLINGKVVIILDNSPIALVLPTTLSSFSSTKNEINTPKYYSFLNKVFVSIFLIISVFLLGFFVSVLNFHSNLLSPILIANIQSTERGTSFPIIIEVLIILFLYEFYRYATSRSPQNYIQSIVIFFGSLVVGQNAIQSGTIGSLVMMVTSLSYLSSFAVTTNPYLITSMNIARLIILIFSYLLGLIGFIFSVIIILLYLRSQEQFSKSFLEPFSPINFKNIFNFLFPVRIDQRGVK